MKAPRINTGKQSYTPKLQGFPFLTLAYLQKHGESKAEDIRRAIGLNEWSEDPNHNPQGYSDRSAYHFDIIIRRLIQKKVVKRTKHGYYKLA